MNEADKLRQEKINMPGSEKFTRPEEIKALSKYLGAIRETIDSSIELESQLLGVPGRTTGKIPEISKLSEKVIDKPDNQNQEISSLGKKKVKVSDKEISGPKLSTKRLGISDLRELGLSEKMQKLEGTQEVDSLRSKILQLQDTRDQELNKTRLDLEDQRQVELEEKRLDIKDLPDISLEDKKLDLSGIKESELSEKRLEIHDDRKYGLSDKRINISDILESKLSEKRLDISDLRDTKLGDKKLELSDERQVELSEKRLDIEAEEISSLENKRLDLSEIPESNLSDKKIQISDTRETKLSDKLLSLSDIPEPELSEKRLDISDLRETELPEKRLDIEDTRETELPDKRLDIEDIRETELSEKRLDIEDTRDPELSDKIISPEGNYVDVKISKTLDETDQNSLGEIRLSDDREIQIDKTLDETEEHSEGRIKFTDLREYKLDKTLEDTENSSKGKIKLSDIWNPTEIDETLEDTEEHSKGRVKISDTRELQIDKTLDNTEEHSIGNIKISDTRELSELASSIKDLGKIEDTREDLELPQDLEDTEENSRSKIFLDDTRGNLKLEDNIEGLTNKNPGGEVEELHNSLIAQVENMHGTPEELYDSLIQMASDYSKWSELEEEDYESLRKLTNKLSDDDLYNVAITMASSGERGSGDASSWFSKVSAQMSSYLSSANASTERLKGFIEASQNNAEMAIQGAKAIELSSYNNSEITELGDKKVNLEYNTSKTNSIWAKAAESTSGMSGITRRDAIDKLIIQMLDNGRRKVSLPGSLVDVKGLVGNVTGLLTGTAQHPNPINHPLSRDGMKLPGGPGDAFYQPANSRTSFNSPPDVPVFYNSYWSSESFKSTLYDLCPGAGAAPIVSLMELKTILEGSPYITTPGRFSTVTKGLYKSQTLDTNMYWEVTMDPYCCKGGTADNGGFSYLPSIKEINVENKEQHKVITNYGSWAPITGFELQKTKLSTRSIPLFNGEIQFPDGLEFTNELRLTFVDDSWKSWRRYFEKCAKVAAYNSTPHRTSYYTSPLPQKPTEIDETLMMVALYKNITFDITVYVLNPQFNMLKKYRLLCVLKDFSEDYAGEIDAGGTDLTVTFSIVGENPMVNAVSSVNYFKRTNDQLLDSMIIAGSEIQKLAVGTTRNSIGLL